MKLSRRHFVSLAAGALAYGQEGSDPVAPWKGVRPRPVSDLPGRHTIHTYFNVSPETIDGSHVLYYTSTTPEGHSGEIRMQVRATGEETVLVRNLDTEDAHRVACQQWVCNDRQVVFHDMRNGEAVVAAVDVKTRKERVLAKERMVSFGFQPSDLIPIYGVHFQPGKYTDVELLNVATGEIKTLVTAKQVRDAYPEQISKLYGDLQISTPFGVLSPDEKLIFFKLSAQSPNYKPLPEGHLKWPRSYQSDREGLVCYDIEHRKLLFFRRDWGHPSWDMKSTTILNAPNVLIDGRTGAEKSIPNLPRFPGQHHSFSPDGRLFVTDTQLEPFGGVKGEWGVAVCDVRGGNWTMLHRFRGDKGATTWRKNHPHPAFSPDGNRIYYNVNSGTYTQLHVAERSEPLRLTRGA
jgi:hypothetical protein